MFAEQIGVQREWYTLICKPGQDGRVACRLDELGYEYYRPTICAKQDAAKLVQKTKPKSLYPRYIFIKLIHGMDNFNEINFIPGVSKFLRFGDTFAVVTQEIIDHTKEFEKEVNREASQGFKQGNPVCIKNRGFEKLRATYKGPARHNRSVLLIDLLNSVVTVSLANECIFTKRAFGQ